MVTLIFNLKFCLQVKQSLLSSVFSTIRAFFESIIIINKYRPQLIICNGPGTCVPVCYAAFLFRVLGVYDPSIIFVESFCRVDSLSVTGLLLYFISDKFLVHWPELLRENKRAEYIGKLC